MIIAIITIILVIISMPICAVALIEIYGLGSLGQGNGRVIRKDSISMTMLNIYAHLVFLPFIIPILLFALIDNPSEEERAKFSAARKAEEKAAREKKEAESKQWQSTASYKHFENHKKESMMHDEQ